MRNLKQYREYRKKAYEEGMPQHLSSGLEIRIRPASQSAILRGENIPNELLVYFAKSEIDPTDLLRGKKVDPKEYKKDRQAIRLYFEILAKEMIIWPRVVDTINDIVDEENEIALEELEDSDLAILADWSSKGMKPFIDFFRREAQGDGLVES